MPLTVLTLVLGAGAPANAAGNAQLTVTVVAVDAATGDPITAVTSSQPVRRIAFRVDFSCLTANCDGATVAFDPTQLDPNYATYRLLRQTGFTPPATGGSVSGTPTTGYTVALGNLIAGQTGQFTLEYGWQDLGQSAATPDRQDYAYANFPDGFPITQTVRANAATATGEQTATTTPVIWHIPVPDPTIAVTGLATPTSGFFSTDTNISYQIRMTTGCKNDSNRFTYDFQCSSAYTVTHQLPPGAVLVSAAGNPVVTGDSSTGLVLTWTGPPWAPSGDTSLVGWAADPRTVTISFPRANVAPAGQSCDFTTQFNGPTGKVDATYISMPGTTAATRTAALAQLGPFPLKCSDPFPRAEMDPKQSTYDGSVRPPTADATVVIPVTGANLKEWRVTVANTANIPGVAVVTDDTLDQPDLPVYQIAAPAGSTIVWTATDGTTTTSGTSTGTADAPAGFRFVTSTVTSPTLAPPNTIPEQHNRTAFTVAYRYKVTPDATNPTLRRINTASAVMQWPDNPQFPDTPLGPVSGAVTLIPPFSRIDMWKGAWETKQDNTTLGGIDQPHAATTLDYPIPGSGTAQFWWNVYLANKGNAPAIASVTDPELDYPGLPIRRIISYNRFGGAGTYVTVPSTIQYTLDDGTTGTIQSNGDWTAPTGRRIVAATVTGANPLPGGATLPTDTGYNAFVVTFFGSIRDDATPDARYTNTTTGSLDYGAFALPTLTAEASHTAHLIGPSPVITAALGQPSIAGGASQATPTTDVTFRVAGSTASVPKDRVFTPEYVFMAPAGWNITPGSASFPAGSVPPGVTFDYRTVTIGGVDRQVVVASWPAGTVFGGNTTLPTMSVIARPSPSVPVGTTGVPRAFVTNSGDVQAGDVFTREFTETAVDIDGIPATTRFSEAAVPAGVPVGAVAAMQVLKEICFPDASQADGCRWYADPSNKVGVAPNTTAITYRISVTNTGNTTLSDVVGYDILPYPGDTGTSDSTAATPRGSTFQETLQSVTAPTNLSVATFSGSTEPCRSEVRSLVPPACTADWGSTVTGASAIRLARAGALSPGSSFSMEYTAAVSGNPPNGAVACNSFAVKATGLSLVSEPAPVCASIEEADLRIVAGTPHLQTGRPGVLPWTITNLGGAISTQGQVDVPIPAGIEVTSFTPAGWVCTAVDGDGTPVYGTATGPATLTCVPDSPLVKDVPQALDIPARPTTTATLTIPADVSGRMFDGNLANNHDQMQVTATAAVTGIGVTKTDGVTTASPGQTLTYTISVTNPLDFETLTGATLADALPSQVTFVSASDGGVQSGGTVTWSLPDLPAQATVTRTVTVSVPPTISLAQLTNGAGVSAPDPDNPGQALTGSATDVDTVVTRPAISIVKSATPTTFAAVGDTVTYAFEFTNTGDVTLTGVTLTDPLAGLSTPHESFPDQLGVLAPGQSATATATYTVTQADLDRGRIDNTATVSGTPPAGDPVTATASRTVTSTAVPHLTLTKDATGVVAKAGDTVTYSFTILNDGPVALQNVAVTDPLPGLSALVYAWPGDAGKLAVGQSATATATYHATQADVDAGGIHNTATADGQTAGGTPVSAGATHDVPISGTPRIDLVKRAVYAPGHDARAGDVIEYRFAVTNTGTVTLTTVGIADAMTGLSAISFTWPGTAGSLAPGEVLIGTAAYRLTQADIDRGRVTNTATTSGLRAATSVTDEDAATVVLVAAPQLTLEKTASIGAGAWTVGMPVSFVFTIANTGNVTEQGVAITDALPGLSAPAYQWPGQPGVLEPGQKVTATATYALTAQDVQNGKLVNVATAKSARGTTAADSVELTAPPMIATLGALPVTGGGSAGPGLALAGGLLLVGGALLIAHRRRSRTGGASRRG